MGLNQGRKGKARVIAKIKGFTDLEPDSADEASRTWVSVLKPNGDDSDTVTVSFGDQPASRKDSYEFDYCYERNEGNGLIFSREVNPLIEDVFNGDNVTLIAYGARGTGKTFIIQGSEEEPGLAVLAMTKILSMAEESGKYITISCYEILKDHVYDLLDSDRHEVLIWEDISRGKVQLKGLSQVPVKTIQDFQKLYPSQNSLKQPQKMMFESNHRSHKGLIIHVFHGNKLDVLPLGKMNFVDLAGYEDVRRKSIDGVNLLENNKINKSIYALQNVVYALNSNESHVPYRESKLTRMLRDSLGRTNKILMVTCLNSSFCQDSLYMANLASRSCKGTNRIITDSTKKSKSMVRALAPSSSKSSIPARSVSASVTKQISRRVQFPENKVNNKASAIKGRKLFDEASHSTKSKKASQEQILSLEIVSTIEHATKEEEQNSDTSKVVEPLVEEFSQLQVFRAKETDLPVKATEEANLQYEVAVTNEDNQDEATPNISSNAKTVSLVEADQPLDKENNFSVVNENESPPISARLQELSNNLKLLYSSIPLCTELPPKNDFPFDGQVSTEVLEPKTPECSFMVNDKFGIEDTNCSPWRTFSARSSKMKNSLVNEYIKILNTADKEDLKKLKGIGEKRATYILELREESPEPFKSLDDLKEIGLSAKQIKEMVKKEIGGLFD